MFFRARQRLRMVLGVGFKVFRFGLYRAFAFRAFRTL